MKVGPVHAALREATAQQHLSLESDADLEARLRDPARRVSALSGLLEFHRQADAQAVPVTAALELAGLERRGRAEALSAGLVALGAAPDAASSAPPFALHVGSALGWLYVAEGSSLGGRVIRKTMIRDGVDLTGLDFLDPHGEATGPRWAGFLAFMQAAVEEGRATSADVVDAAVLAFDRARVALVPIPTVSRAA